MNLPAWLRSTLSFGGKAAWVFLFVLSMLFDKVEGVLTVAVAAVFLALPGIGANWFRKIERFLAQVSRHRIATVGAVVLFVVFLRLALLPILPIPSPITHDEFSYIFAGDTFSSGRLTNPTHPMWVHFETFHVSQQPTAFSKYFPAQGLFLALGQTVFGHPWYGVVLSMGMMCGAILWMLQQWVPPGWALLGASLLATRLGVTSYWMNSYWGGAVAALGGALVWGALPGVLRGNRARYAVILGIGLIVLANSRPLEGALVSLPAAGALAVRFFRLEKGRRKAWLVRSAAPVAALLVVGALAVTYYNWRLTGDPLLLPHQAHDSQYVTTNYSLIHLLRHDGPYKEREYNHKTLRDFWVVEAQRVAETLRSPGGFFQRRLANFRQSLLLFIAPVFMICFAALPNLLGSRRILLPGAAAALFILLMNFQVNPQPHYFAPALAPLCLLGVRSTTYLRHWTEGGQATGLALVRAVALICLTSFLVCVATKGPADIHGVHDRCYLRYSERILTQRDRIIEDLTRRGGRHLIIVRYTDNHIVHQEWVYNRADVDNASVVWAREMTAERNRELFDYFRERTVWLVEPDKGDEETVHITPYRAAATPR